MYVLKFKNKSEIKQIVKNIGSKLMKKNSHGYNKNLENTILDSALEGATNFLTEVDKKQPVITLMAVILSANRNYNRQVEPHVMKMKENLSNIKFKNLKDKLNELDYIQFSQIWGHKDEKKYKILTSVVNRILMLQQLTEWDDLQIMKNWAKHAQLKNRKDDLLLGGIPNIGVATFQHLRICFGCDTVKPDQRVKEVLSKEFGIAKLSDEEVISLVEEIASITQYKVIEIDQIFVKYGSGYYASDKTRKAKPINCI